MDQQTDSGTSHTHTDNRAHAPVYTAGLQPHFDLLAQDISADLVVDFWIRIQHELRARVREGYSLERAVRMTRDFFFLQPYDGVPTGDAKLDRAGQIADAMRQQTNRKLAD